MSIRPSGVMSFQTHTTAAGSEVIITWPSVGYYSQQATPLNTFQLVVREDDYLIPDGEGQIGFFWTTMGGKLVVLVAVEVEAYVQALVVLEQVVFRLP